MRSAEDSQAIIIHGHGIAASSVASSVNVGLFTGVFGFVIPDAIESFVIKLMGAVIISVVAALTHSMILWVAKRILPKGP